MLRELSCRQYIDWQIMYGIEPWGEWRADLRMGILASNIVAPYIKKNKDVKPKDFMPDFTKSTKERKQTPEQQAAIMRQAAASWGKIAKKGGK